MKRLSIIIISLISIMIVVAGCALAVRYDGPYEGRVIDAETGNPIEGAVVLGVWNEVEVSAAGGTHTYYDAQDALTDKKGEFKIRGLGLKILGDIEQANVMIFKAGYEDTGLGPWEGFKVGYYWGKRVKWEGNKAIMPLRKLNREERIKRGSPPLPPAEAPKRKVINMLREINKNNLEINLHPIESWGGEKL